MTSLRELSGGRPIDREALLDAWLDRLEPRYEALRLGRFDAGAWSSRQRTTGELVEVDATDGRMTALALGVDPETGALLLASPTGRGRGSSTRGTSPAAAWCTCPARLDAARVPSAHPVATADTRD